MVDVPTQQYWYKTLRKSRKPQNILVEGVESTRQLWQLCVHIHFAKLEKYVLILWRKVIWIFCPLTMLGKAYEKSWVLLGTCCRTKWELGEHDKKPLKLDGNKKIQKISNIPSPSAHKKKTGYIGACCKFSLAQHNSFIVEFGIRGNDLGLGHSFNNHVEDLARLKFD